MLERAARERTTFNVTELERFADCSSAWLVERFLDPRTIDAEVDAKLRGSVAHTALYRSSAACRRSSGPSGSTRRTSTTALGSCAPCLDDALQGVRMELADARRGASSTRRSGATSSGSSATRPRRELAARAAAVRGRASGPTARRPSSSAGSSSAAASSSRGKIDRIDVDPFSARGIVQDYKSGKGAHSAQQIEDELRLQVPLYMLVLRDLVGIEPLGGVYRPLAGERAARGLLRAGGARRRLDGLLAEDYLDEDAFWAQVEGARARARELAERIRGGDVRHDPQAAARARPGATSGHVPGGRRA